MSSDVKHPKVLEKNKRLTTHKLMASIEGPPLDFSFRQLSTLIDFCLETPRRGLKPYRKTRAGRYNCTALRLNNNVLHSATGLVSICARMLERPEALAWLDLSFNQLTELPVDLFNLPGLKILYLHSNLLNSYTELTQLTVLPQLYTLTLHGNPIETSKNYRGRVLSILPNLKSLDFSQVTSGDREDAKRAREEVQRHGRK